MFQNIFNDYKQYKLDVTITCETHLKFESLLTGKTFPWWFFLISVKYPLQIKHCWMVWNVKNIYLEICIDSSVDKLHIESRKCSWIHFGNFPFLSFLVKYRRNCVIFSYKCFDTDLRSILVKSQSDSSMGVSISRKFMVGFEGPNKFLKNIMVHRPSNPTIDFLEMPTPIWGNLFVTWWELMLNIPGKTFISKYHNTIISFAS